MNGPNHHGEDLATAPWLRRLVVAAILAGLVVLVFQVLQPFIVPVLWACILAYVSWPLNERLVRLLGGRRSLAAFLMTLLLTAAVIVPVAWLFASIRIEAVAAWHELVATLDRGVRLPEPLARLPVIGEWLREFTERAARDPNALRAELSGLFDRSFTRIGALAGDVGRNIGKLLIAIISLFFVYRDGERLATQIASLLAQLLGARVHDYVDAVGVTVKAVVYGLVLAALAQGSLAGLGYWVAGLDAPVFLAALTTLAALIPFMVPLVWGGASLWLLAKGATAAGIGLFLWGLLAVSWIDNVVRPLVISNATRIPFLLVLFGVLGGIAAFGLVGLFIGPVILAVMVAVWREWSAESRHPTSG